MMAFPDWLIENIHYTEKMNRIDEDGEDQCEAENRIAAHLFYDFEEYSSRQQMEFVYDTLEELFSPLVMERISTVFVLHEYYLRCLPELEDASRPNEEEANEISRRLVLLGLDIARPDLAEPLREV